MFVLQALLNLGWSPILITIVAILGYLYKWPIIFVAPALVIILIIGLITASLSTREKQLERSSMRLKEIAGYFTRRFTGDSSLSIFSIIQSFYNLDNTSAWAFARTCDVSRRIFNTWCDGFISRAETDLRTRMFNIYMRTFLNELWLLNTHYYEYIEQFYEIAQKVELTKEIIDQYNRFVTEYNAFTGNFRDIIMEFRRMYKTEIEPPSVKLAQELPQIYLKKELPGEDPTQYTADNYGNQ